MTMKQAFEKFRTDEEHWILLELSRPLHVPELEDDFDSEFVKKSV